MGKVSRTPPLKQFRELVEQYIEVVESEANFYSDDEWIGLILRKLLNSPSPSTLAISPFGALIRYGEQTGRLIPI